MSSQYVTKDSGETDEDHAAAVLFNLNAGEYVKWRIATGNVPGDVTEPAAKTKKTKRRAKK